MCTLTYIPGKNGNYRIASNRDEGDARTPSLPPGIIEMAGQKLLYPKDPDGGGTWLAISEQGRLACLLNGAFGRHLHQPPYRMSRGLVVLQQFMLPGPCHFYADYPLSGIEPFTLVIVEPKPKINITEIKWDGSQKHLRWVDPERPQIWSSEMLYDPADIQHRHTLFSDWLKEKTGEPFPLRKFHLFGRDNPEIRGIFKNKSGPVATVSLTSVEIRDKVAAMKHENFLTNSESEIRLPLMTEG
ncbi:MAG: NRDE family protein [Bacteroidia bacterium]